MKLVNDRFEFAEVFMRLMTEKMRVVIKVLRIEVILKSVNAGNLTKGNTAVIEIDLTINIRQTCQAIQQLK